MTFIDEIEELLAELRECVLQTEEHNAVERQLAGSRRSDG